MRPEDLHLVHPIHQRNHAILDCALAEGVNERWMATWLCVQQQSAPAVYAQLMEKALAYVRGYPWAAVALDPPQEPVLLEQLAEQDPVWVEEY